MPKRNMTLLVNHTNLRQWPTKTIPLGFLDRHPACQAMYWYWGLAQEAYTKEVKINIVEEGKKDPEYNYKQLLRSIALAYGVQPEEMVNFLPNVRAQLALDKEPYLPELEKYLFHNPINIRTRGH